MEVVYNTKKNMKAVLFARVSSREQEETGYSLPAQEKLLKEYTQKRGFAVAKIFSISESAGGRYQRKTFDEMLEYVQKNNINILICEKVDRLTRNLKDAVSINDWINDNQERQVHFVKENCILTKDSKSNEKFIWNIKVSVSQYYIDNLSEEVKKGQKEKIAQGWLPTRPPLGYKTVGEKGHKIHVIDEEKAPFAREMFELYATGDYSLKKLVQTMFEEGLRTRGGNKLGKSRTAELLSDPFYYGKIRWNDEIYEGQQDPLISKELFDKVQSILHSKNNPKYCRHAFLFKGLMRCVECEGTITWESHKGITYGHCNHYRNCSQQTWVKEPEVEAQVIEPLDKLQLRSPRLVDWVRRALKDNHQDEITYHNAAIENLQRQLERTQRRLDALYDDKLDEEVDKVFYERRFKEYTTEKEQIVASISKHTEANTKYFELGMNIYELSQKAPEIYQKATSEEKRQLLGLVFQNLTLNEGKLNFSYTKPFEILAGAVEVTNGSKAAVLAETKPKIFERQFSEQKGALSPNLNTLLRTLNEIRTFFSENPNAEF